MAATCVAGTVQYYGYPDATSLPDTGRILMWDGSASKNITGSKLKTEVINSIATPSDTPITKQAATSDPYKRQIEVKDSTGRIVMFINASGQMIFGTPVALSISSVAPVNGATGVSVLTSPLVTFNKSTTVSLSTMYIQGNTTPPRDGSGTGVIWQVPATPLAYGTSYTLNVVKNSITQTDGETASSCGSAMTDVSGVCKSTWTTAHLALSTVTPTPDSMDATGTDGGAFTTPPGITFSTEALLVAGAGSLACTASYYNGSGWQTDSVSGDPSSSDNLTWILPSMTYHKTYDASHKTTYSCAIHKSVGLTTCAAGTTNYGDACQWKFDTAL